MLEVQSTPDTTAYFPQIACSRVLPSFLPSSSHSLSCSSHHQHYTSLCKTEGMGCTSNYVEDLLCTHRLSVLTQVKTLTVYHVGDLFAAHPPVWGGKEIHYSFFYLHMTKIHNNITWIWTTSKQMCRNCKFKELTNDKKERLNWHDPRKFFV